MLHNGPSGAIVPPVASQRPKAINLRGCDYNASTEVLTVEFTAYRKSVAPLTPSGRPYRYYYLPVDVYTADAFLLGGANGVFFNEYIRGAYYTFRLS